MADKRTLLEIRNLYKIFGAEPQSALERVKGEGLGRTELMDQTGHVLALSDINTKMREGDITVIMGLSGSGKSTLIRHLNRLIEPTAGEILLDGDDVLAMSNDDLRRVRRERMSMVFQNFALLPHRTVLDNAGIMKRTPANGWSVSDWAAMPTSIRTNCRAVCSSVSGWPVRWRRTRRSC